MKNETRILINHYIARVAELNGVTSDDVHKKFTAAPSVQQTLFQKIQESSEFLTRINMPLVPEMSGELIGMGVSGTIARRTNTATGDRLGKDPTTLDDRAYLCKFTEFDTHLTYAQLDQWAKFPEFQVLWANSVARRIALDLIMIGWNGTSAAAVSDPVANTLLQDVNIGWLQKNRSENIAGRNVTRGKVVNKVTYGNAAGDYLNLDSLVYDMKNTLLPTWTKDDPDLVAFVSSDLLHDKYFPIINQTQDSENLLASDIVMSTKRLGGLPAVQVPFFPAGKIFISTYRNLSIYHQEGSNRRMITENPKRSRVEDYQSMNHAYVIENLEKALLIENVQEYVAP